VALGKTDQMTTHFPRALRHGVTKEELMEMITHMAFYSGWPTAVTATVHAQQIFSEQA
jgi:4-carboxymuconolactone decarboxylase